MSKCRILQRTRSLCRGATALAVAALLWGCRDVRPASGQADPPPGTSRPTGTVAPAPASAPARAVVSVRRETLRRYAPAVGSFRARQTTKLGPQVSGRVQEVLVEVGDLVTKDQVLVRLDPAFFEIEVQQNRGAVEAAKGALASAAVDVADTEREMQRQLELFRSGAGSTKERDDAIAAHDRAVANRAEEAGKLTEAEKRLEYAQERLEETQIRAPYDGAITARIVDPGEPAAAAPPTHVLEIQEVGVLHLEFSLPQELLDVVGVGTPIEFEVEGVKDGAGTGTVAVVFPALDEATRSLRCRAILDNKARKYQPGLLARVKVVTQEAKDALVVPRTALSQTASGWQALLAVAGRLVATPVEVGLLTDDGAQVLRGLAEGDQVVAAAGGRS
jgi:membrane fusion protein (multidrug efflux system)